MALLAEEATRHERPVELLRELIRFDTTNPPGNERECISYIERLLSDAGLETVVRGREPDRPNLVARLRGRGNSPPLLLYGHVDVVTTANQQWQHPPFEAELLDGYVWGRGAIDMKGGIAMMLGALLRARARGLEPAGDVVFCALADEENFSGFGARYLVEEHKELFEGIRHAIGEFGGFALHMGGRRFYPIQVAEKQLSTVRATVRGPGGHGATPVRGGAVAALAAVLRRLDRRRLPVHVTPVVREMCDSVAAVSSIGTRALLRLLLRPPLTDRILDRMGQAATSIDPLLHNTASPTVLRASEKLNVIPSEASVLIDGRLLPGFGPDDMLAELRPIVGDEVELEVTRYEPGPSTPDMALFDTLGGVLRQLDAGAIPMPLLMAGVTDGRFFSQLGIQTYGFLPMNLPPEFDFWKTVHAANERVPAQAIEFGAEAIYRAIEATGGSRGSDA
jgi:acetylornithine deacetylase/succinyl-diaminopimelate desuccinylase-like protein